MSGALQVDGVRLYPLENAKRHRTDKYEVVHAEKPTVVLRRGQEFDFMVKFRDRGYDLVRDTLQLVFTFDAVKKSVGGTAIVTVTGSKQFHKKGWDVRIITQDTKSIKLEVRSSPEAPVGEWNLRVEAREKMNPRAGTNVYSYPDNIYLLFNPWDERDLVYMKDERLLNEYVLNDLGKIWVGNYSTCRGREWVFGQFDDCVLPAAMMMLDRAMTGSSFKRWDPVEVTRALTRIVNSNDEDASVSGVLHGEWSGDYEDGTAPAAWTGSVAILEEYLSTGQEVKYGQCWVFAGVLTTVCRALGIPSRVVTNLVSGYDTKNSLTVVFYHDSDGKYCDKLTKDSIWEYHVWNEAWMARRDLPDGYGGWQAIDSTPTATSNGFYQCGPASVEAVKNGMIGLNYDVSFVLTSVNADFIRLKKKPGSDSDFAIMRTSTTLLGQYIYTKRPWIFDPNGDTDREDITNTYKAKEGTLMERVPLENARKYLSRWNVEFCSPNASVEEDMVFKLADIERINIGDDFVVVLNIENKSDELRTVKYSLSASSVYYNGFKANTIKSFTDVKNIYPHSYDSMALKVEADDYLDKLVEYCHVKIFACTTVDNTDISWADEDGFQVVKPALDIQFSAKLRANIPATVTFSFTNPLQMKLEGCSFKYESPGVLKPQTFPYRDISPGERVVISQSFTPKVPGEVRLVGTFVSKQLVDITGSTVVQFY